MFPSFLPETAHQLTESASISILKSIQRDAILTPLRSQPIITAYIELGQNKRRAPLLFLHGFDSSLLEFRYLLPSLANERRIWAVDLLGFGFTDKPEGIAFSPPTIKTHLYCFWKTRINQPVILVGASMGGATAIDFTLTHPEVVEKLILIDSVGYTSMPEFVKFLFPPLDGIAVEYLRQRQVKALELSALANSDPHLQDLLRCTSLHMDTPRWHEAIAAFTKSGGYGFLANKIGQIRKPTLILWGKADDVLGTADAEKFHQNIAGSRLVWIDNCGHAPQIEQPEIVREQILQFI